MKPKLSKAQRAAGKFFMGVGRVKAVEENTWRDEWTRPLFPLPLIMDAEGTLADDAKHLVGSDDILHPVEVRHSGDNDEG